MSDDKCSEILEYERFASVVKDAADLGAKTICLSGGEPFLHPRIVDMTAYINSLGLQSFVYTSGIVFDAANQKKPLDKDVLKAISGTVTKLIFNIEAATPEIYDRIMGTNGCFEKMKQSVSYANSFSIITEAHFVPMKININEVADTVALCKELNVSKTSFLRLVLHGRALTHEKELSLSGDEILQLKILLEKTQKNADVNIRIGIPFSSDFSFHKCEAANGKINIKYDGKVFPCEVFKNDRAEHLLEGLKPDSIFEGSLRDIYYNSKYLQRVRELSRDFSCSKYCETCIGQHLINYSKDNDYNG
jgi:MoaA/NifB/PqqE/SkfB family radical SAM enzyme